MVLSILRHRHTSCRLESDGRRHRGHVTAAARHLRFSYIHKLTSISQLIPSPRAYHQNSIHLRYHSEIMCGTDIFLGILAVFFPPLAVWVKRGLCSADSLVNIALCCKWSAFPSSSRRALTESCTGLGVLPGLLHAWYIIYTYPEPTYEELAQQDAERGEGGNVTYYYVQQGQPQYAAHNAQSRPQGYGTVNSKSTPNAQFPASRGQGFVPGAQAGGSGGEAAAPPSYQQATGDHKVQRT